MSQDGGRLVNSKSVFRAVASGNGVSLPRGSVCSTANAVAAVLEELLATGCCAIVKQDYLSGGHGNEIVSPGEKFRPIGAPRVVVISSKYTLCDYVDERWEALSQHGRNRVVVEEYFRDSRAFFAEYRIDDEAIELAGTGELLSAPFAIGQVMPAVDLDETVLGKIVAEGRLLCAALKGMGYRGVLSTDAVVTPRGEVYFTEYNGRITGSTHIYGVIGAKVIGQGYGRDRMILERVWPTIIPAARVLC